MRQIQARNGDAELEKLKELIKKYRHMILYVLFGGLTTVINMAVYALCYEVCGMSNVLSTVLAWLVVVLTAYITNKVWVFESRSFDRKTVLREMASFFGCRIATGVLDVGIMYGAVDVMGWNGTLWKLISNVIVIILNYIASKLLIFRKKEEE